MTVFWSLATTMALLALAFVLPPLLLQRRSSSAEFQDELNTEVTRQRLAELKLDLESGRLEQARYEAARQDLERELLNDLRPADNPAQQPVHSGRWAALLIAVAVPLCATLLYKSLGSEPIIALLQQPPAAQQAQPSMPEMPAIEDMVGRLATRLQEQPDDLRGWVILAKSYSVLDRYELAVPAYRNIMRLGGGNDAGILADFADALATTGNGVFTDEVGKLLTDALQLDPDNIKALWLAGQWKRQSGDTAAALAYWEHAAGLIPAGSEDSQIISEQIQQLRQQAGLPQQALPQVVAAAPAPASNTAAEPAAAGGGALQVTVSLDPALRDRAADTDTVFIYARAASGPRMPLAIVRKQVSELPVTVTLDDSMAMAPGMVMSGFPELAVGARISKSGNAMPQSGDLQGSKSPVHLTDTTSLDIVIDSAVP
jgi:cytochrome c-type biogenesis protein CcmH